MYMPLIFTYGDGDSCASIVSVMTSDMSMFMHNTVYRHCITYVYQNQCTPFHQGYVYIYIYTFISSSMSAVFSTGTGYPISFQMFSCRSCPSTLSLSSVPADLPWNALGKTLAALLGHLYHGAFTGTLSSHTCMIEFWNICCRLSIHSLADITHGDL